MNPPGPHLLAHHRCYLRAAHRRRNDVEEDVEEEVEVEGDDDEEEKVAVEAVDDDEEQRGEERRMKRRRKNDRVKERYEESVMMSGRERTSLNIFSKSSKMSLRCWYHRVKSSWPMPYAV
jgi:hypothetical protein